MFKQLFSKSTKSANKVANLYKPSTWREKNWGWRISLVVGTYVLINALLMFYWSREPDVITPNEALTRYLPAERIGDGQSRLKTGTALTAVNIHLIDTLLNKNGGYISNDILPPGLLMDNMPEWEWGVLRNLRDLSKIYRNNFSTSGTQTKFDEDLAEVENRLSINSDKWMLPSPEKEYKKASQALNRYLNRIIDDNASNAQFYARADNLARYFNVVAPNLGSYSQRLSESVGMTHSDLSLAGDKNAEQSTQTPEQLFTKTPWTKVDNNFYEARGYAWALLHQLKAIEIDFQSVLEDKNATLFVRQLIRELEGTQKAIWSPIILNGEGFGMMANHSLIMASYLSRANAIMIDLSVLLERG
ncbi:DUF2333 family protein [Ostreibacterium oceani]|uniref:DUF2333 family protein n=1 Tax=Ostreibacterium oceani TaxID=2654998 RepID=A0A6N7ERK9_9GAMM|nr:DUF2333 family protein [Ostreibacterium oceani]MPV85122.1 DUF2333 family protein [Ostreibacterium oceani]